MQATAVFAAFVALRFAPLVGYRCSALWRHFAGAYSRLRLLAATFRARLNNPVSDDSPRRTYRVLTRTRGGYNGSTMYDVQLQIAATGNLVWAQTFTDREQAEEYEKRLDSDLDELDEPAFRRKYNVTSQS